MSFEKIKDSFPPRKQSLKEKKFKQIKKNNSTIIVENAIYSIESTIAGEEIPDKVQQDLKEFFSILKPHLSEIVDFFED